MALSIDRKFGQAEEAGEMAAIVATSPTSTATSLLPYYLMAVAAGVSVWFITRWLGRRA